MTYLPNPVFSDKYVYGYEEFNITEWYSSITKYTTYTNLSDTITQIAKKYNIKSQFILAVLEADMQLFSNPIVGEKELTNDIIEYIDTLCQIMGEDTVPEVTIWNNIDEEQIQINPKNKATSGILRVYSNLSGVLWLYNIYGKLF